MTKTIGFRGVPYFQSRDVMAMETYGNMDMHKAKHLRNHQPDEKFKTCVLTGLDHVPINEWLGLRLKGPFSGPGEGMPGRYIWPMLIGKLQFDISSFPENNPLKVLEDTKHHVFAVLPPCLPNKTKTCRSHLCCLSHLLGKMKRSASCPHLNSLNNDIYPQIISNLSQHSYGYGSKPYYLNPK